MEYLWLHNKPKAAVHPEQKLKGPNEEEEKLFTNRHGVKLLYKLARFQKDVQKFGSHFYVLS
jgi:hypothetical protein